MSTILYLHGFNSSPQSHKARALHDYMERLGLNERIVIPAIPPVPDEAIELLQHCADEISNNDELALAGSSLGDLAGRKIQLPGCFNQSRGEAARIIEKVPGGEQELLYRSKLGA